MIALLSCTCGGSEHLLRGTLRGAKGVDWLNAPIYKGKDAAKAFFDSLPEGIANFPEIKALQSSISHRSRYAVVLGYNENGAIWTDVTAGSIKNKLDAQIIAEKFSI